MSDLELDTNGDLVAVDMLRPGQCCKRDHDADGNCDVHRRWSRWDAPQPPPDLRVIAAELLARRRPPTTLVSVSFFNAWCRRWAAHRLSRSLGYPSKEPPIR